MGMFGNRSQVVSKGGGKNLQQMELEQFRKTMEQIAREDADKMAIIRDSLGITQSLQTPEQVQQAIQTAKGGPDTTTMVDVTDTEQGQLSSPEPLFDMARQVREEDIEVTPLDEEPKFSFGTEETTQEQTEALPLNRGTTTSTETSDILTESQKRLKESGYYRTTVDGRGGRSTSNAVKTFQYENGLDVTGELDQTTRDKLSETGLDKRPEISDSNNELLSFIGKGESGGYGAANDYGNGRTQWGVMDSYFSDRYNKPLDQLTIREIQDIQSGGYGTREVFAVGAYQLIPDTLNEAVTALGLTGNEVFNQELQDRIAIEYLAADKRPDLRDWLRGVEGVTRDEALMAFAKEWASIPVPYDITRKGVLIRRGESYYKPEGNTANAHTAEEAEALLDRLRAEAPTPPPENN
jgi:peptidoglycan hydrolase-like protein with peptidoglycan-binding domain